MSGISAASATIAARHALDATIRAALSGDDDVDITFGSASWPVTQNAWVAQQGTTTDTEPGPLGPTRHQAERLTLFLEVGAWVAGSSDATATAAFDRAFGVLSTIQNHIRVNDITLGGTVLWCVPGPSQSDGIADEDASGYYAIIAASFVAAHRIRTGS
jgi:hypothetical protein